MRDAVAGLAASRGMICTVAPRFGEEEPAAFVLVRNSGEEAEIITIAVAPQWRGCGAGRVDGPHCAPLAGRTGTKLFLEVNEKNRAALALYKAIGFRQVGTRKGYYKSGTAVGGGRQCTGNGALPCVIGLGEK
ncbi:MAG: GNAT family N-acetyltransferase [Nitratireductor sp.]